MTPATLLAELRQAGLRLELSPDGALLVSPRSALDERLRSAIRTHKAQLAELVREPATWNAAVADAWVQITLARVSRWYDDELAPDCLLDDPSWDEAEALVTAAYAVQDRQGLRQALDAYEAHARQVFDACRRRGEKESAAG